MRQRIPCACQRMILVTVLVVTSSLPSSADARPFFLDRLFALIPMGQVTRQVEVGAAYNCSVGLDGEPLQMPSGSAILQQPQIGGDGRFVVLNGFLGEHAQVWVHDRLEGLSHLASANASGEPGNTSSFAASLSDDGRYVAFTSLASNLVAGAGGGYHMYLKDNKTGRVTWLSSGLKSECWRPDVSGDGTAVVFRGTNVDDRWQLYRHDVATGVTRPVPRIPDDWGEEFPTLSDDGFSMAYESDLAIAINGQVVVPVRSGDPMHLQSLPRISGNGRTVAFHRLSDENSVTGNWRGVFVYRRGSGAVVHVSRNSSGQNIEIDGPFGPDYAPAVNYDGRYVAFTQESGSKTIYLRDMQTPAATVLATSAVGPSLNSDGHLVAYHDLAQRQVTVRDRLYTKLETPSNLQVEEVAVAGASRQAATGRFLVRWQDQESAENAFQVHVRRAPAGTENWAPWEKLAQVGANVTQYQAQGQVQARYQVRVRAVDTTTLRFSDWRLSDPFDLGGLPGAPTNLTVALVRSDSEATDPFARFDVTWQDNSTDETAFELQRRHQPPGGAWSAWQEADLVGPGVTTTTVDLPFVAGEYQLRVRGQGPQGDSAWATSGGFTVAPPAPTQLLAEIAGPAENGQVPLDLSWRYSDLHRHPFDLQWRRMTTWDTVTWSDWQDHSESIQSNLRDWNAVAVLAEAGTYQFRLRAGKNDAYSPWCVSNIVDFRPVAPSDLGATLARSASEEEAKPYARYAVTWSDNSDNEDSFRLERRSRDSVSPAAVTWSAWTLVGPYPAETDADEVDLPLAARDYQLRVRAENPAGVSAWATSPVFTCALPAPKDVAAAVNGPATPAGDVPVLLTWAYEAVHRHRFEVQTRRFSIRADAWEDWGARELIGSAARQWDLLVSPRDFSAYQYRLRAMSPDLNSPWATSEVLQFDLEPPTNAIAELVRSDSTVTPPQGTVRLTWQDNSNTETGFEIAALQMAVAAKDKATLPVGTWTPVAVAATDATSAEVDVELTRNLHRFRVRAVNSAGASSWEWCDAIALRQPAPTEVTATIAGPATLEGMVPVQLTWKYLEEHRHGFAFALRSRPEGGAWSEWEDQEYIATPGARQHTVRMVPLDGSGSYQWSVVATGELRSERGESNVLDIVPPTAPANVKAQLAASDSVASPATMDLRATWQDRSDTEDAFWVEWRHRPAAATSQAGSRAAWSEWEYLGQAAANATDATFPLPLSADEVQMRVRALLLSAGSPWAVSPAYVPQLPAPTAVAAAVTGPANLEGMLPVQLTWRYPAEHRHGFILYLRSRPEGGAWSQWEAFETLNAPEKRQHTAKMVPLDETASYQWAIAAASAALKSPLGEANVLDLTPPVAPARVQGEIVASNSTVTEPWAEAKVSWQDRSDDEDSFWVEWRHRPLAASASSRARAAWSDWDFLGQTDANVTQTTLRWQTNLGEVQARVRAVAAGVYSTYAVSPAIVAQPPAPTNVVGSIVTLPNEEGSVRVRLNWEYSNAHVHRFLFYHRFQAGSKGEWTPWEHLETVNPDKRSWLAHMPYQSEDAQYQWAITANGAVESEFGLSNVLTHSPNAPGDVQAAVLRSQSQPAPQATVHVRWQDLSLTETGFRVQRRHRPAGGAWGAWTHAGTVEAESSDLSEDLELIGGEHQVRVQAFDEEDTSDWTASPIFSLRPPPPTEVFAHCTEPPGPSNRVPVEVRWKYPAEHAHPFELQWRYIAQWFGGPEKADWSPWQTPQTISDPARRQVLSTAILTEDANVYQYRLRTTSAAGASDWCVSNIMAIPPQAPGLVRVLYNAEAGLSVVAGEARGTFDVVWRDNAHSEDVFFVERRQKAPGASAWGNWQHLGHVEANAITFVDSNRPPAVYQYRVCANNAAGQSAWVFSQPFTFTQPAGTLPDHLAGYERGMNLVGLPIYPTSPDPGQLGCDPVSWARWWPGDGAGQAGRYVWWQNDPQGYPSLADPATVPGKGFWANFDHRTAAALEGSSPPADQEFTIPLGYDAPGLQSARQGGSDWPGGWVQIANPRLTEVPWIVRGPGALKVRRDGQEKTLAEARAAGWCEDFAWGCVGGGAYYLVYDPAVAMVTEHDRLLPWRGYWFLVYGRCELVVPPVAESTSAAAAARPVTQPAAGDWTLPVQATLGGEVGAQAVLGQAATPRALSAPPAKPGGVQLSLVRSGRRLGVDLRAAETALTWDLEVASSTPRAQVTLTWPDMSAVPARFQPVLVDRAGGTHRHMRTTTGYTLRTNGAGLARLQISFAADDPHPLAVSGVTCAATSNGGIDIRLHLSAAAAVSVEVLNLSGRTVGTVCNQRGLPAGASRLLYSGQSDKGTRLPAGRYLVRVTARAESGEEVAAVGAAQLSPGQR